MDCQLCFQTHVFWHGHSSYWRGMGDGRSNNQIMLRGTRTSQWLLLIWRRVGWVWKRGKRPEQYGNDKSCLALYAVGKSFDTAGKGKNKGNSSPIWSWILREGGGVHLRPGEMLDQLGKIFEGAGISNLRQCRLELALPALPSRALSWSSGCLERPSQTEEAMHRRKFWIQ